MSDSLISTLLHVVELAVVVGVTLLLVKVFHVNSGVQEVAIGLVLAGLTKFARASDKIPLSDYVNN